MLTADIFHTPNLVIGLNTAEEHKQKGCMAVLYTGSSVSMTTSKDQGCRDELVLSLDICSYCIMNAYRLIYAHTKYTCKSVMDHGPARRLWEQLIRAVQQGGVKEGKREVQLAEAWAHTDYLLLWSSWQKERTDMNSFLHTAVRIASSFPSPSLLIKKKMINEIMA